MDSSNGLDSDRPVPSGFDVAALVDWYAANARDLPWRRPGTSPWAVLVSEIMLQQTPVVRVYPAWLAWTARWPTPGALAIDSPGEAVRMWAKLGYPRRALRLHESARVMVARHGGSVPSDLDALLALPGVGAYTARAVATFAFGQRQPVVDINVRRVVARAVQGQGAPGPAATTRDLAAVSALLPADRATATRLSIALMELGALVCTAARPRCDVCPIVHTCAWRRAGYPVYDGPTIPRQGFAGTDRQVRGRLLDVLRDATGPVESIALDSAWPEPLQRARALDSLVVDGLVDPLPDGRFALPGRHGEVRSRSNEMGRMDGVSNETEHPNDDPTDEPTKQTDDAMSGEAAGTEANVQARSDGEALAADQTPADQAQAAEKAAKKARKKAKKQVEKERKRAEQADAPSSVVKAKDKTVHVGHKAAEAVENAVETSKEVLVDAFDKAIDSIDSRMNRH